MIDFWSKRLTTLGVLRQHSRERIYSRNKEKVCVNGLECKILTMLASRNPAPTVINRKTEAVLKFVCTVFVL